MRSFQFSDAKSHKFWNIEVKGNSFTVTYGKVGTAGQSQTKSFTKDGAAQAEADKLIKEKLKKGYTETTPQAAASMAEVRSRPGKDVWLFGGGSLFRSFAELGLVDTVEVAVIPVLLGAGVPLLPAPAKRVTLKLTGHKLHAKTGTMSLEYAVHYGRESKRRR